MILDSGLLFWATLYTLDLTAWGYVVTTSELCHSEWFECYTGIFDQTFGVGLGLGLGNAAPWD